LFKSYLEDLQLTDLILPVEKDSSVAAESFEDNSIDIIFIDANHSYEGVKKDLQSWFSKVKIKGIIAGHDFWAEQVKSAVLDFMATKSVKVFETSSSCWIAQK
jgi:predicted O-methyltransferase YrrM